MRQYVVDTFTRSVLTGNPAAVCVLETWPDEVLMQAVAAENNLSETAFAVPRRKEGLARDGQPAGGSGARPRRDHGSAAGTTVAVGPAAAVYDLRWFTPGGEIDLCGHATLATALVVLEAALDDDAVPVPQADKGVCTAVFHTRSGPLRVVRRHDDLYEMALPAYRMTSVPVTREMERAYGARPSEAWLGRDLVCVFDDATQVRSLQPDGQALSGLDGLLQHATALTDSCGEGSQDGARRADGAGGRVGAAEDAADCVSRSFAPRLGVAEDPVCGSGHCHIVPLWAQRLGRDEVVAYQASSRGGTLYCRYEPGEGVAGEGQVHLAGEAVVFSVADLAVG